MQPARTERQRVGQPDVPALSERIRLHRRRRHSRTVRAVLEVTAWAGVAALAVASALAFSLAAH